MDKRALQSFSTWAKDNLENQIEVSLRALGVNSETDIKEARRVGDVTVIEGDPNSYSADLLGKRDAIVKLVQRNGYCNVIEEFAYTWFNRFIALRFMEVHGFLSHGFRVLSNPAGGIEPEIMKNVSLVKDELHLDMNLCADLKQQGKIEDLYRHVLVRQCNALSDVLPMLFSNDMGYLELLLPKTLLKGETVITRLLEIPEETFLEDVEIIGWMYQFYISSKKDAVFASKKTITKDTLPAVTQLFTPDWIVRYMAQNSVGRLWMESYPDSSLRSEMKYYVEDAKQTEEVQRRLDEIKYKNVNPEEIRIIEPCCGSGHILVYVFDLLFKMYEERGYQKRNIPTLILKNNLTGLDVDKRASQLASFALVMKARSINNRFFEKEYYEMPHVYEIIDSQLLYKQDYINQIQNLKMLSREERELIYYIVETFKDGKTIGALLIVKSMDFGKLDGAIEKIEKQAIPNLFNYDFLGSGVKRLKLLSSLAKILSSKYDVMITNPPYIGISSMERAVKDFAYSYFPNSKTDMYAMFMETGLVLHHGYLAMINMHGWMFQSSYEEFRKSLLENQIVNVVHLGARAFDEIGGEVVQATTFVIRKVKQLEDYVGTYIRLTEYIGENKKEEQFNNTQNYYYKRGSEYKRIPGMPIAYWSSDSIINAFINSKPLSDVATPRQGVKTLNNDLFLRLWFEVSMSNVCFGCGSIEESIRSKRKWFPYNKGGSFRKWYGNNEYLVNWYNDGLDMKKLAVERYHSVTRTITNISYFFRPGLTWSALSSGNISLRAFDRGFIFDSKGSSMFFEDESIQYYLLALMNSKVTMKFLEFLAPTLDFNTGSLSRIPVKLNPQIYPAVDAIVKENIRIAQKEWDSFETSWDYVEHPLVRWSKKIWDATAMGAAMYHYYGGYPEVKVPIELCFMLWQGESKERFDNLKKNEEELNRIFIDIYGLQDELSPIVEDKDVTVRLANKERDIRSLISYLVGVAMGRYSLDTPGLTYAGGMWDETKYRTYQPDDDGIIPIYSSIGMEDGLTTILIKLIKLIFDEESYRENIDFIAESLGKNTNESSEETLNRYLNDGFYADHLKMYQKRPIYWLFTSGKKAGFKCLVYMHRYDEDTLARINAKYFLPETTRKKNELEELSAKAKVAEGREGIRLEKARQSLAAAYNEAIEYGQVLDHVANQYIKIDLDDGVKVNYAKFQEVEIVTDSGNKVRKDLLYPIM